MTPDEQQKLLNQAQKTARQSNAFLHNFRIVGSGVSGNIRSGFACRTPPCEEPAAAGTSGGPVPPPPTPTGACCAEDGSCTITTEAGCTGAYQGNDSVCDPNPCPQPTGACCAEDGSCAIVTEAECAGIYQGDDTVCDPNPCPQPTGACCVGVDCTIETEVDCSGMGGTYQGDDTTCDPNPCEALPPCDCGSPYGPFDESSGHFKSSSGTTSGTIHTTQTGTMFDITTTWESTITGEDCGTGCSCSGGGTSTGTLSDGSPYSCAFSFGSCGSSGLTFVGGVTDCGYGPSCWTPGANTGSSSEVNTRTTRHNEWHFSVSDPTFGGMNTDWDATADFEVSNECII